VQAPLVGQIQQRMRQGELPCHPREEEGRDGGGKREEHRAQSDPRARYHRAVAASPASRV
jgi:hypothetical protein